MSYQTVAISVASSGDNTLVAAPSLISPPSGGAGASYQPNIRVHGYVLVAAGAVTAQFFNGASANNLPLSGAMSMITGTPIVYPQTNTFPSRQQPLLFVVTAGNALVLKLGGAIQVSGHITYSIL